MTRGLIVVFLYSFFTFYGYQAIKTATKHQWVHYLYIAVAVIIIGNFIFQFLGPSEGRVLSPARSYAFGLLLAFMALNLVMVPILFAEDIVRLILGVYDKLVISESTFYLPERRKFLSQIALGLGAIPFASLLYGMYRGKYDYRVLSYQLFFEDLPDSFDGYRITHISDIHS
ncbi:MAG: metallophosphoesterase, partial [Flavobacteriaceae bacterium]|nr:metallophosphoesterase [Flavobacteriaceae bacterium]